MFLRCFVGRLCRANQMTHCQQNFNQTFHVGEGFRALAHKMRFDLHAATRVMSSELPLRMITGIPDVVLSVLSISQRSNRSRPAL